MFRGPCVVKTAIRRSISDNEKPSLYSVSMVTEAENWKYLVNMKDLRMLGAAPTRVKAQRECETRCNSCRVIDDPAWHVKEKGGNKSSTCLEGLVNTYYSSKSTLPPRRNFATGDVVLPPRSDVKLCWCNEGEHNWPENKGKDRTWGVVKTLPDTSGVVRRVKEKTKSKELGRPVNKQTALARIVCAMSQQCATLVH